jgi:hypothetical protein
LDINIKNYSPNNVGCFDPFANNEAIFLTSTEAFDMCLPESLLISHPFQLYQSKKNLVATKEKLANEIREKKLHHD